MRVRWFGQSAWLVTSTKRVMIDPFGSSEQASRRGLRFSYPPIRGVEADLVLVTHEHFDHNAADAIGGSPEVIRSTAGTFESPAGEVVAVASEHDEVAGTRRGPNAIFVFTMDGLRLCHMGDFGQPALRPEQRKAIGEVDVLFVPVGSGPTIGGQPAAEVAGELEPRLILPMHFRTDAVDFLEPPDAFLAAAPGRVERVDGCEADVEELIGTREDPVVAVLDAPMS